MPRLAGNTIVAHPETGAPTVLLAGDEVPDWAEELIGAHLIDGASDGEQVDGLPPKAGKGSGIAAWKKYADDNGVSYTEGATRDEIIAAVEAQEDQAPDGGAPDPAGTGDPGTVPPASSSDQQ